MWNRKRIIKAVAVVIALWIVLVCARMIFSKIDYSRVDWGGYPVFTFAQEEYKDGGTIAYQGLGYRIIRQYSFHVENGRLIGYDYGPVLEYQLNWLLLPLENKSRVRLNPSSPGTAKAFSAAQTNCPVAKQKLDL